MRNFILTSCALGLLTLASCAKVDNMPEPSFDDIGRATEAASRLQSELRTELMTAIKADGPAAAVQVCAERAPALAETISLDTGYQISEMTLSGSGVGHSPDAWESHVMVVFEEALASRVNPKFMEHSEVVLNDNGVAEFRWMKPIFAGQSSAVCHEADVEAAAARLLADGAQSASDAEAGDLRGAYTVRKALETIEVAMLD
tara:strand:- start:1614 stop:2219 length:606 start_codon:yes stop_codon:yes gene_type:complete